MKNTKLLNISKTERTLNLKPFSINYKITDDEFLELCRNVIIDKFGDCPYNLRLDSDNNNFLQILFTGDLVNRIYGDNLTRSHEIHRSYYVLKFILDSLFGLNAVNHCTTSYRNQNKLFVEISIPYLSKSLKESMNNLSPETMNKYKVITKQLDVLEEKRIQLLEE